MTTAGQITGVTGLILAGGQGRRMGGQDKGLVTFRGRPLIEHILEQMIPQVDTLLISANRHLSRYAEYDYPVIADTLAGFQGPLAGVLAGMAYLEKKNSGKHSLVTESPREKNTTIRQSDETRPNTNSTCLITLPCDSPFVDSDYVKRMLEPMVIQMNNMDEPKQIQSPAVAQHQTKIQPVHALIPVALKTNLEAYLSSGERQFAKWLEQNLAVRVVFPDSSKMFDNFNTPEQLSKLQ